jgi:GDP-4-dehydro-6-deoxy-D-mannose reductase
MKVLITGATGFIGGFLARHCLQAGCTVLGLGVEDPKEEWPAAAVFESCDVRNEARLLELIIAFRPERIFHLAAQSFPTVSLEKPFETMSINAGGTINIFECLRTAGIKPMVVVACSSAEYGPVEAKDLPVREDHALRPLHPYGVSKVAQDLLAAQYFANYGLPCVRIRIFNTTGPSKVGDVCSDLTKRAAEIDLGIGPPSLRVGNLNTRRAIIDGRDMARGLWLAAERCEPGEVYNVGANQIYSVQELIDAIRPLVKVTFEIEQDPALMRSCDELVIAGDITKFQRRTGWKPEIELSGTIREMLDWWRRKLGVALAVAGS